MNTQLPLDFDEKVVFQLRSLYSSFGYHQYKMNKFEPYDLYAGNKDFLICDRVITFPDSDGKLMALKPDVTLSIVKNSKDQPDVVQKLCYNENVYRTAKGSHSFREIMQVGLECLGNIDDYCICEVLQLAAKSLECISSACVLSISHLGLLLEVLQQIGMPASAVDRALQAVGQKNTHELAAICESSGVSEENTRLLVKLVSIKGTADAAISQLEELFGSKGSTALAQLKTVASVFGGDCRVRIDFSVVDDARYYSGIVFKGFAAGLPESVLTGGQYDKLMQKMGRKSSAIGFAVYMDALERLDRHEKGADADVLLLYRCEDPLNAVLALAEFMREKGLTVMVQSAVPQDLRFATVVKFGSKEAQEYA